jgi:hypothetical protein
MRDTLLDWNWMTETFDSDKNNSLYKPTELGVAAYSAIVKLVGKDSLVNGYKLDVKRMEGIMISDQQVKPEVVEKLIKAGIITQSYNPSDDVNKYELTPEGAKLFVAFFVTNNRVVGTLPGDTTAAFFNFMNKLPERVVKASEIIEKLGNSFQAFDSQYKGKRPNENNFNAYTPRYGKTTKSPKYGKSPYKKNKSKRASGGKRKKTKGRASSSKKQSKPRNGFSEMGDKMMKDMEF